MRIIKMADLVETPWKNGGGITRNIAAKSEGGAPVWRLSMADVATAGAFSSFPGLTRILTVIEGTGMILHAPRHDLRADFAQPVTFDGATPITAELTEGPLRDFNLMFDARRCHGVARAEHGPAQDQWLGGAGETTVLHCIKGRALANDQGLMPGDTALAEGAALRYTLPEGAIALSITLGAPDTAP